MQQLFLHFSELCARLAATSSRLERARLIAGYLQELSPGEAEIACRMLVGRAFPEAEGRRLALSGRAVWEALAALGVSNESGVWAGAVDFGEVVHQVVAPVAAADPTLTLGDVSAVFAAIASASGSGSRRRRIGLLTDLFRRATAMEAKYITKIVIGEMRHGVHEGIVLDAVAALIGADAAEIRRANQALGDVGRLAFLTKMEGRPGLAGVVVQLFRPLKPMLAQTAADVATAMAEMHNATALEWKLDGARVQIHKQGQAVRLFSRRLKDITESLPEIVELVGREVRADSVILEGEVMAVSDGRSLPFQELMRRFRRIRGVDEAATAIPVKLYLFDVLWRNGTPLLDLGGAERWQALQEVRGDIACVSRTVPTSVEAGDAFFNAAISAGAEGLMAKSLVAPYTPGVRGTGWLKIKKIVSLDLAIIAADWGYGRRHGWLSNYHLAARDNDTGEFVAIGKTFKGLTDDQFRAMTERLLQLKVSAAHGTVTVRPAVVVEVRFGDIQKSPQYACGMALRFARIFRIRGDKGPSDVDTLATVRALYQQQFERSP